MIALVYPRATIECRWLLREYVVHAVIVVVLTLTPRHYLVRGHRTFLTQVMSSLLSLLLFSQERLQ